MTEPFYSSAYGQLHLSAGYPAGYKGPFLAGGKASFFSSEVGSVTLQEIAGEQFALQLYSFQFLKKTTLIGKLQQGLHSLFVHKGDARCAFARKRTRLRVGQYVFCNGAEGEWKMDLLQGKPLQLLKTSYGQEMTLDALSAFPSLTDL